MKNENNLNKFINKKMKQIFSIEELRTINRNNLNKALQKKILGDSSMVDIRTRISLISRSDKAREAMALCQFKNDFDTYLNDEKTEESVLFKCLNQTLIIYIYKEESILNYEIAKFQYIDETEMHKLNSDIDYIIKEIKTLLDRGEELKSVKGECLVCKPKDNKPYKPIFSSKYNRIISNKNYGWYFRKKYLTDLIHNVINETDLDDYAESKVDEKEKIEDGDNKENLMEYEFYKLISSLKVSSKEAIANPEEDDIFSEELYIKRPIEDEFIDTIQNVKEDEKKLIFLIGNSGDGKSMLLNRLKKVDGKTYDSFDVHNDATESYYVNRDSIHTLVEVLRPFNDNNINEGKEKVIVAINMGIIGKLIDSDYCNEFSILCKFLTESNALKDNRVKSRDNENEVFDYFSFSEYNVYSVSENGLEAGFVEECFDRIFNVENGNIFNNAYNELSDNIKSYCPVCYNFKELCNHERRAYLVNLILYIHIHEKIMLTPRIVWNLIYELIMGKDVESKYTDLMKLGNSNEFYLKNLYYNKLLNPDVLNPLIRSIVKNSELIENSSNSDKLLSRMVVLGNEKSEIVSFLKDELEVKEPKFIESIVSLLNEVDPEFCKLAKRSIVRYNKFINNDYQDDFISEMNEYSRLVYEYNFVDKRSKAKEIKTFREVLKYIIKIWNGKHFRSDLIYDSVLDEGIKKSMKLKYNIIHSKPTNCIDEYRFSPVVEFTLKNKNRKLIVDFNLYRTIKRVKSGYQMNFDDRIKNVRLNNFIGHIVHENDNKNEQYICDYSEDTYILNYDTGYNTFEFEKE